MDLTTVIEARPGVRSAPPKAIWLRVGNATTNDIHQLLADAYDTVAAFAEDADEALLVLGP